MKWTRRTSKMAWVMAMLMSMAAFCVSACGTAPGWCGWTDTDAQGWVYANSGFPVCMDCSSTNGMYQTNACLCDADDGNSLHRYHFQMPAAMTNPSNQSTTYCLCSPLTHTGPFEICATPTQPPQN